jgi:hypothetical protein
MSSTRVQHLVSRSSQLGYIPSLREIFEDLSLDSSIDRQFISKINLNFPAFHQLLPSTLASNPNNHDENGRRRCCYQSSRERCSQGQSISRRLNRPRGTEYGGEMHSVEYSPECSADNYQEHCVTDRPTRMLF